MKIKNLLEKRIVRIIILVIITILACLPLFIHGIEAHFGQDLGFHLNRIEGIVTELKAGHFPVKMESFWMDGYGYPVPIYYGDILLYIPALLRLMGIGVVTSYKCYVILITFATVLIAYLCFKKIFVRYDIALALSLILSSASDRLENVYIRAAVGEYTAMAFYPIILLAMYLIYTSNKEIDRKEIIKNATLLALGVTGLVNTHILSLEIVGIVLIIFCLIKFKKTFTGKTILTFLLSGVEIVIVNLFFIIPFVDYFVNVDANINNVVGNARTIQDSGMYLWEYFSFFKMPFSNVEGVGDGRLLVTPGIVCILSIVSAIILWVRKKATKSMKAIILSSIVLMFLSSRYFPWNFLAKNLKVGDFLAQVQFPWRYIGIVLVLLTWLAGLVIEKLDKKVLVGIAYTAIILATVTTDIWFTVSYKTYAELKCFEEAEELDTFDMGFIEYLRANTIREDFTNTVDVSYKNSETGDIVTQRYDANIGTPNHMTYRNGYEAKYEIIAPKGSNVTFPIVNYKGYKAYDKDDNLLDIEDGDNDLLKIDFDDGYEGEIYITFEQPAIWIVAEIISLIGIVLLISILVIITKRGRKKI